MSDENTEQTATTLYRTLDLVYLVNSYSVFPANTNEYSERVTRYRNKFPDNRAEIKIIMLIIESRALIPAIQVAIA